MEKIFNYLLRNNKVIGKERLLAGERKRLRDISEEKVEHFKL